MGLTSDDDREDDQNSLVQPSSVGPWSPEVILISAMLQPNSGSELGPRGSSRQKEVAKDTSHAVLLVQPR